MRSVSGIALGLGQGQGGHNRRFTILPLPERWIRDFWEFAGN
jgi:hypothetical protein